MPKPPRKLEVWLAFGFGLFALAFLFAISIFATRQTALLVTVARVTLALACAGIAAVIPGFLHIQLAPAVQNVVRAGGALAVFAMVYFFNPPGLLPPGETVPPPPAEDYMPVVASWLQKIDAGRFVEAYDSAGIDTHNEFSPELFESIFRTYLGPLGAVTSRTLQGATAATRLQSGETGTFRLIGYDTTFTNGQKRFEQVIVEAEDGKWVIRNHHYAIPPGS